LKRCRQDTDAETNKSLQTRLDESITLIHDHKDTIEDLRKSQTQQRALAHEEKVKGAQVNKKLSAALYESQKESNLHKLECEALRQQLAQARGEKKMLAAEMRTMKATMKISQKHADNAGNQPTCNDVHGGEGAIDNDDNGHNNDATSVHVSGGDVLLDVDISKDIDNFMIELRRSQEETL
jgi:hypothetical protein